ncbi:MAG TPA: HAMP domain-containing sensor histidine kinase [Ktedonobacteraceae bacterium]|nr:HAMP domain-containing sensor histidine kinase [Ktedonobacteraceae bacterium]
MRRLPSFRRLFASLPLRWRLALVSLGLLATLLISLGILISASEEQTLLTNQANALGAEASLAQGAEQGSQTQFTPAQIQSFPTMSDEFASSLVSDTRRVLGQGVGVSMVSFDGRVLTTPPQTNADRHNPLLPGVTLAPSTVQHWLITRPTYLLTNDTLGQRELVVLQPIVIRDKSVASNSDPSNSLVGYSKALLQLSVLTTPIDQSIATTRLVLILGILAALGIAIALTLPLINLALRPLVEMERVSTRIAAGALSLRLTEPDARDEIGRLARAFNSMVARLEVAFARQKRFVADVSHELRTPLTGLGGSLEMLLLGATNDDEEAAHRLMSGMYAEVERMQRLVADLLALTRLDEGRLKLHLTTVEVAPLLADICTQMQSQAHSQSLTYQVPPNLPALRGDADQLRRVLLNIVENALKFTPPGGCVELRAANGHQGWVTLEIQDTGAGIPPEALPHVFERFYRADPSRTRQSWQIGGSGLGLSIARELVEAHGGTIAISSSVGQGTTVTLRLSAHHGSRD